MKSKKIIIIATLFATLTATAQSKHEFSIQAGGGISSLEYSPTIGESTLGVGFDAGVGYTYFFNSHWGIGTGVGAKYLAGKYELPSLASTFQSNDGIDAFEYRYSLNKYSEQQQALLFTVPLMLHFQSGKFYAAVGGKVGLPLSATYSNDLGELQASGYYAPDDLLLNDPAFMGFGTFNQLSHDADLSLKTAFFASAEVGAKWRLSEKLSLYTGVFVDYGLNNLQKSEAAKTLIEYNAADASAYLPNSVLASGVNSKAFVDKITPLSAGIKLSIAFGSTPHQKAVQPIAPATDYQPVQPPVEDNLLAEQRKAEAAQQAAAEQAAAQQAAAQQAAAKQAAAEQQLAAQQLAAQRKAEAAEKAEQAEVQAEVQQQYVAAVTQVAQLVGGYVVNSTTLLPASKTELDEKAAQLQRYPNLTITVEGHTCNIGTHKNNLIVGQRRAQVVKKYLVQKGIAANRITTVSKAETEPIAPNDTEANRQKNRRIVVTVVD